jgi:hypothetical protein
MDATANPGTRRPGAPDAADDGETRDAVKPFSRG